MPRANEYAFTLLSDQMHTQNKIECYSKHGGTATNAWHWNRISLLLVQDNHNQDADSDHDDDGGDYGPFNSKYIQYNSSYDRILRKQICPSQHPPPPPSPSQPGLYGLQIIEDK